MFNANVLSLQKIGNFYKHDKFFTYQELNNGLIKLTKSLNTNQAWSIFQENTINEERKSANLKYSQLKFFKIKPFK